MSATSTLLYILQSLLSRKRILVSLLLILLVAWIKMYLIQRTRLLKKRGKRITIAARQILLWNPSSDFSSPNFAFSESVLPTLTSWLSCNHQLTLIHHVHSDLEESQIKQLYLSSGLYRLGLDPRRVLFCDTAQGLLHMVQHLEPQIHLDTDVSRLATLRDSAIRKLYLVKRKPATPLLKMLDEELEKGGKIRVVESISKLNEL